MLNGVDDQRYLPADEGERDRFRRELGLNSDTKLIAFIGRLEEAKGSKILIEYARQIADSSTCLLVQYPGFGKEEQIKRYSKIAAQISSVSPGNVHIVPDEDPKGRRIVRYCDFLIHPSLSEVAPLTVIESWMSGVGVIATNSTSFYEEVHIALPAHALYKAHLPNEINWRETKREFLKISGEGARSVAQEMHAEALRATRPTDETRDDLATMARDAGFTLEKMAQRLDQIYSDIERSRDA